MSSINHNRRPSITSFSGLVLPHGSQKIKYKEINKEKQLIVFKYKKDRSKKRKHKSLNESKKLIEEMAKNMVKNDLKNKKIFEDDYIIEVLSEQIIEDATNFFKSIGVDGSSYTVEKAVEEAFKIYNGDV
jgi:hypothetical protein